MKKSKKNKEIRTGDDVNTDCMSISLLGSYIAEKA